MNEKHKLKIAFNNLKLNNRFSSFPSTFPKRPENLLLTSNDLNFIGSDKPGIRLKLADFGLAVEMKEDEPKLYTVCGTMFYISPEQLLANHGYDLKVSLFFKLI